MKIVILDGATITAKDLTWDILKEFGEITYYPKTPPELVAERIGDAEIVLFSKAVISAEVMDKCPNIKYFGELATGYDNIDIKAAAERGIPVTNIPAYSSESVAQHTIALMLEVTNQVGHYTSQCAGGRWHQSENFCYWDRTLISLTGKSLGIIGYGSIGKRVAAIAEALGMKINIYSRDPEAAVKSDVVSLHCPATAENTGMINSEFIAKMKDGAILINTARGKLVKEADLAAALKSGKLLAAACDVLNQEPPTADNPLIGLDNFYCTPHLGWSPKDMRQRILDICYDNMKSWQAGGDLNRVN